MAIETIGEALDHGWRVTVRCAWGPSDAMKRRRECVYGGELDMTTLVWTRGRAFPLGLLESRLRWPSLRIAARARGLHRVAPIGARRQLPLVGSAIEF